MTDIKSILSGGYEKKKEEDVPETGIVNADVDSSPWYFLAFLVLGTLTSAWVSYLLAAFNQAPSMSGIITLGSVTFFFFLLIIFQSLMIKSQKFNIIIALAEGGAFLTFLLGSFSPLFLVGVTLFFVLWLIGFKKSRQYLQESLKVRFRDFATTISNFALIGFALMLGFVYAGLYQHGNGLSFDTYKTVLSGSAPAIKSVVPNFVPDMTVDGFFEDFVAAQLERYEEGSNLTEAQKQETTRVLAERVKAELLEDAGVVVAERETIAQYSYRLFGKFFTRLQAQNLGYVIVLVIVGLLFFPIRLVLLVVKWPLIIIASLLFAFLKSIGLIRIQAEMRSKEILVLK